MGLGYGGKLLYRKNSSSQVRRCRVFGEAGFGGVSKSTHFVPLGTIIDFLLLLFDP